MPTRLFFLLFIPITFSISAHSASFDQCPQNFYDDTAPYHTRQTTLQDSVQLCFNGFATLYSGVSRTPLWSAEHLTRQRLTQAQEIPRDDTFHSEQQLPERMRAYLSDYKGSGYDRGHVAPSADMASVEQQYDSFSLVNIFPQSPKNNRYIWRNLESVTRYLTKRHGEAYVVTGVAFNGQKVIQINDHVVVPSHVYKAVYFPAIHEAGAYYAPNDDSERLEVISINELNERIGADIFPTLPNSVKSTAMVLPAEISDIEVSNSNDQNQPYDGDTPLWLIIIMEIICWLRDNFIKDTAPKQ